MSVNIPKPVLSASAVPRGACAATAAVAIATGLGKWVKVYWAKEPNGTVILDLNVPGEWDMYLCFQVWFMLWKVKFCLLAVR